MVGLGILEIRPFCYIIYIMISKISRSPSLHLFTPKKPDLRRAFFLVGTAHINRA